MRSFHGPRPRGQEASALLMVFWALLILAGGILAWASWIAQDIALDADANRSLEARSMAHSGIAVALNPAVSKATDLLNHQFTGTLGYRVKIISEGGKLNVNWLIQGEDPNRIALFKRWLDSKGLKMQEREVLVDCLLDYVDPDNLRHINGMEDNGDYHPANRPLTSIEEIAKVWGSGPLTKIPGWKDSLTIDSQGPIDLIAAPTDILLLLGLSKERVQHFIQIRAGKDGIDGTVDDYPFKTNDEVFASLGLAGPQRTQLEPMVMLNDPNLRIISDGQSGKVTRQVEVVATKAGTNATIKSWKE